MSMAMATVKENSDVSLKKNNTENNDFFVPAQKCYAQHIGQKAWEQPKLWSLSIREQLDEGFLIGIRVELLTF